MDTSKDIKIPKVLAIRTDFQHHGEDFGYKQILKFTQPFKVIGVNERNAAEKTPSIKKKYLWLFEFDLLKYSKDIDLVHILYGEDYYRWSYRLFKKPLVVTFHQPADILEREVLYGDYRGRIGRITHIVNKNRFKHLVAAIVTNKTQIDVLKKVMPEERIHYIPLGIHVERLNTKFYQGLTENIDYQTTSNIITVGNWMRDWAFYLETVKQCPEWTFHLINRNMDKAFLKTLPSNVKYYDDISDAEMFNLYLSSSFQFLPLVALAGSNAFIQGLGLGCPIVMTDINAEEFVNDKEIITLYEKGNVLDCVNKMKDIIMRTSEKRTELRKKANSYANQFSWEMAANKTIELYKKLI